MAKPAAVILDIDGTLLLSNDAHARSFVEAARELGFPGPEFDEVRRLIGMGSDKLLPLAYGFAAESEEGRRLDELKGEIFRDRLSAELRPAPGARELLLRFREDDLSLVVATSASGDDLEILLERAEIADLVQRCTTSADVDASKPEPDIVRVALDEVGVDAECAVMIGDTPYDVEAALRAGVRIIGVRSGGWSDGDLQGTIAVYDDPAELLREYATSVFG